MLLRTTSALIALTAALTVTACGGGQATPGTVTVSGSGHFPADGLVDWKSYADHVATYRVVADREIAASSAAERARGEYLIAREVTVEVERRLWSARGAPKLPKRFTMEALGWSVSHGARRAILFEDAPRVAVGERYLVPLVREDGRWAAMTLSSQLRLDGDRVTAPGAGASRGPVPSQLSGRTVAQVRAAVAAQKADPVALRFRDLRPERRVRAVVKAKD
jgi:hypothetical protein